MISKLARERLTYLAMSAFLAWHTAATIVAPAPDNSAIMVAVRPIFEPYLKLLRLDNPWDFFAPSVEYGAELRYVVEAEDKSLHTFVPSQSLSWYHPNYFWARSLYYGIMDDPGIYADGAGLVLCRKHADLKPVSITFQEYQQNDFTPEDHLSGKRPTDPEFVTPRDLKRVLCPKS